jgi:hypothetical protein
VLLDVSLDLDLDLPLLFSFSFNPSTNTPTSSSVTYIFANSLLISSADLIHVSLSPYSPVSQHSSNNLLRSS